MPTVFMFRGHALTLVLFFQLVVQLSGNAELIPVEDFLKPDFISKARLSPDGKHISFLTPVGDRMDVCVYDFEGNNSTRYKGTPGLDVYRSYWCSNERIIFTVTKQNVWAAGLFSVEAGKRQVRALNQYDALQIIDPVPIDERKALVRIADSHRGKPRTVLYNPKSGSSRIVKTADSLPGKQTRWFGDGQGGLAGVVVYDGDTRLFHFDSDIDQWIEMEQLNTLGDGSFEILGYDRVNQVYWVNTYVEGENTATLFTVPTKPDHVAKPIFQDKDYDIKSRNI